MSVLIAILLALFVLPPPWGLVAVGVAAVLETLEAWLFIVWSKRRRPTVGLEALVGKRARATSDLFPDGQVRLDGELWKARCEQGARMGDDVVVRTVEGLTLVVEPSSSSQSQRPSSTNSGFGRSSRLTSTQTSASSGSSSRSREASSFAVSSVSAPIVR